MKLGLLALSLVACASRESTPPAQPIDVPPQPAPSWQPLPEPTPAPSRAPVTTNTLSGTIGGKPFAAQSAVLVRINEPSTVSSSVFPGKKFDVVWSFLFIFDKPMGCADVPRNLTPLADRYVKYDVTGHWPFADGAAFQVGSDPNAPAADRFSGSVVHGQSGSILHGSLRVVRGATNPAQLEMDVSTVTSNTETSGALRGGVAVTICR